MRVGSFLLHLPLVFLLFGAPEVIADNQPKRLHINARGGYRSRSGRNFEPSKSRSNETTLAVSGSVSNITVDSTFEVNNFPQDQSSKKAVLEPHTDPESNRAYEDQDGERNEIARQAVSKASQRLRPFSSARRPPHAARTQPNPRRVSGSRRQNLEAIPTARSARPLQRRYSAPRRQQSSAITLTNSDVSHGEEDASSAEQSHSASTDANILRRRGSVTYRTSSSRFQRPNTIQSSRNEEEVKELDEQSLVEETLQKPHGSDSEKGSASEPQVSTTTKPSNTDAPIVDETTTEDKITGTENRTSTSASASSGSLVDKGLGDVKQSSERRLNTVPNARVVPVYRVVKQRRRRPEDSVTAAKAPHDAQGERAPMASSSRNPQRRRKKKNRSRSQAPSSSQVTGGPAVTSWQPPPSLPPSSGAEGGRKVVCYYTNWSQYRPGLGKFLPENLDPFLCTHVVFAFSSMSENRLSPFEENDLTMSDGGPGLYEQVTALKQVNPRLRVLLALGGWSFGTKKFRDMTRNRYNRRTFVYSVAPYLRDKNFDGLDLDWEYPKGVTDKNNFVQLCRELRESFEEEAEQSGLERLLLTAAVPVGPDTVRRGYDVRELARHLDLFHLMTYDFHGQWESQAGHHSPLNAPLRDVAHRRQLSVNASVHMWMDMGAPAHKIVLGVPTYGRSFTLATATNTGVNAPTRGGGIPGPFTNEEGILAYYEICQRLHSGAVYVWDVEMSAPYMIAGDQWVGFDDERSVRIKMDFVKELGLAGAMIWAVDMDDFTAAGCQGAVYPLITAIREELLGVGRPDQAPDINWSAVAGRPEPPIPTNPPEPLLPVLSQLSAADILAILTAHGISVDSSEVQKLQAQVARAQTPASSTYASEAVQTLKQPVVEENLAPPKIFCYITDWSRFRPGRGQFRPSDLDPDLCTHVVWAFAGLSQDRLQLPSPDQRRSDPDSDYQQLLRLKEANADLKILVSLGGSVVDNEQFRELTSSDYRMNTFVYDTVDSIRRLRLDGLELAWEYPSGNEDRDAYSRLIKEFRLAFNSEASANERARLLLTASLPGFPADLQNEYNIREISEYVDLLSLLAFDLHDTQEDVVRHGAPLFPLQSATPEKHYLSVDGAARTLLEEGATPEKVLIGLATYGRSFTLKSQDQYDIDAPHLGAGKAGKFTGDPGFAAYFEICEFLDQDNTTLVWDAEQQVPFAFNGDYWVGFDDEKSLEKKVEWLRELGLGGVSIWSADLDDFSGACGSGRYPLMSAVREALKGYRVRYTYDGVTVAPGASSRPGEILPLTTVGAAEPVTCTDGDNDVTYHRDPLDCRHYYLCQGRVRHRMPCPSGLVFNEEQSVCDWPENVERCWVDSAAPAAG